MADIINSKLLDTGILNVQDACIVIVKTEWNAVIVDELEKGCIKTLGEHSVKQIKTIVVPGAIEIPFAIKQYWELHHGLFERPESRPTAFIALGCVIRGGTPHFEYVSKYVTEGILQLNLSLSVPTIFGILTVDNESQAKERIGGIHGHKGEEAAITALKMINLLG